MEGEAIDVDVDVDVLATDALLPLLFLRSMFNACWDLFSGDLTDESEDGDMGLGLGGGIHL